MFRIRHILFVLVFIFAVVSSIEGQVRTMVPEHLKGVWVGSCSWDRDTTAYLMSVNLQSPNVCSVVIMDGKVRLGMYVESSTQPTTTFAVDPEASDPNPLFSGAHLIITKLSDYLPCVYYIAFAFEGADELWTGFIFRTH